MWYVMRDGTMHLEEGVRRTVCGLDVEWKEKMHGWRGREPEVAEAKVCLVCLFVEMILILK